MAIDDPNEKARLEILRRDAVHQHFGAPERIAAELKSELAGIATKHIREDPPPNWAPSVQLATQPPHVQKQAWVAEKLFEVQPLATEEFSKKLKTKIPISVDYAIEYSGPELSSETWAEMEDCVVRTGESCAQSWGEIHRLELITPERELALEQSQELALEALEAGVDRDLEVVSELIEEQARLDNSAELSEKTLDVGLDPTQREPAPPSIEGEPRQHSTPRVEQEESPALDSASFGHEARAIGEEIRRREEELAREVDQKIENPSQAVEQHQDLERRQKLER